MSNGELTEMEKRIVRAASRLRAGSIFPSATTVAAYLDLPHLEVAEAMARLAVLGQLPS